MGATDRNRIRHAAVAGMFYPSEAPALREMVSAYLTEARVRTKSGGRSKSLKALIAPHAGYIYSGPIAASAYLALENISAPFERAILFGPCHFVPIEGLAIPDVDALETPLGNISVDRTAYDLATSLPQVLISTKAHVSEHSLEVQLPFLKELLPDIAVLPLTVGDASVEDVEEVMNLLSELPRTLIIVSSDLSHYLPHAAAQRMDRDTADQILKLKSPLGYERACGATPINALLKFATAHSLEPVVTDLRNSGDTAGDLNRVVGYGAFQFFAASG